MQSLINGLCSSCGGIVGCRYDHSKKVPSLVHFPLDVAVNRLEVKTCCIKNLNASCVKTSCVYIWAIFTVIQPHMIHDIMNGWPLDMTLPLRLIQIST